MLLLPLVHFMMLTFKVSSIYSVKYLNVENALVLLFSSKNICATYIVCKLTQNSATWVLKKTYFTTWKTTCRFNNRKRLDTRLVLWCRKLRIFVERIISHERSRGPKRAFISPPWKGNETAAARPEDDAEPRGKWQQTDSAHGAHHNLQKAVGVVRCKLCT